MEHISYSDFFIGLSFTISLILFSIAGYLIVSHIKKNKGGYSPKDKLDTSNPPEGLPDFEHTPPAPEEEKEPEYRVIEFREKFYPEELVTILKNGILFPDSTRQEWMRLQPNGDAVPLENEYRGGPLPPMAIYKNVQDAWDFITVISKPKVIHTDKSAEAKAAPSKERGSCLDCKFWKSIEWGKAPCTVLKITTAPDFYCKAYISNE